MIARRAVARFASNAQRNMSTAPPKTHKAKDVWVQIEATRPKDPHPHVRCCLLFVCFLLLLRSTVLILVLSYCSLQFAVTFLVEDTRD